MPALKNLQPKRNPSTKNPIKNSLAHETFLVQVLQLPGTAFHHEFYIVISVFHPNSFQLHLISFQEYPIRKSSEFMPFPWRMETSSVSVALAMCLLRIPGMKVITTPALAFSQSKSWSRSSSPYPGPACPSIDIMAGGLGVVPQRTTCTRRANSVLSLTSTGSPLRVRPLQFRTINAGSTGDGADGSFNLGGLVSLDSCSGKYTLPMVESMQFHSLFHSHSHPHP
ncbi:hypothetical protein GYMLUDRAFT_696415 [Collybiopsis luxurians FD-317 M1]|uniref:Uncharacterized protein n=1 Tax=Collybiopsis luxurians FD-317 M1 TaxID=944289 RepID=A0A0D0CS15_9AGAR|nr:hypothetical protein GYMLUDRAFT_696415 [Collybiopsis luxurians FD-317 M1]